MYLLELIAKLIKEKKNNSKKHASQLLEDASFEEEFCSHVFLPIDSTNETLACTKCGLVVKSDAQKIKQKNPFNE